MKTRSVWTVLAVVLVLLYSRQMFAAEPPLDIATATQAKTAIDRGLEFLLKAQGKDGSWQAFDQPHPSITALAVKCIAQNAAHGPKHPAARHGIEFILRFQQPDGGIYRPEDGQPNYQTSVALMALSAMKDSAFERTIHEAQDYLRKIQWDDGEGHERSSPWYGGQGYGKHKRPDLSNTQLMVEALKDSGLSADDPVYQKALVFISRSQMLDETNDQPFADGSGDGGFIYTPASDGESMAGKETVDGRERLRSYGSMTYAGFKSLLYAQVDRNDARVRKALDWIRRHYTLDANPNMPDAQSQEGLFYYFHVFAKAMHAWGDETLVDERGAVHHWRAELTDKLGSLQRPNGSWVNEKDRWYEGNPHLVTAYAILSLQTVLER